MVKNPSPHISPTGLAALWISGLCLVILISAMLIAAEINRQQQAFDEVADKLALSVQDKLATSEAILTAFTTLLENIDPADRAAANRFAAEQIAATPHVYMLEVARQIRLAEIPAFEAAVRRQGHANFKVKNFADITERSSLSQQLSETTWPIVFMYPRLAKAEAIYGTRLETVDYLTHPLAIARQSGKAVASPVFEMYEGGRAYILLQTVKHGGDAGSPNIFGGMMVAMLLLKTDALMPPEIEHPLGQHIGFFATLHAAGQAPSPLFVKTSAATGWADQWFLPHWRKEVRIDNQSQPTTLEFDLQLRWSDVLAQTKGAIAALLAIVLFALTVITWRARQPRVAN